MRASRSCAPLQNAPTACDKLPARSRIAVTCSENGGGAATNALLASNDWPSSSRDSRTKSSRDASPPAAIAPPRRAAKTAPSRPQIRLLRRRPRSGQSASRPNSGVETVWTGPGLPEAALATCGGPAGTARPRNTPISIRPGWRVSAPRPERRGYAPVGGGTAASPMIYPTGGCGSETGDRKAAQDSDPDSTGAARRGPAARASRQRTRWRRHRGEPNDLPPRGRRQRNRGLCKSARPIPPDEQSPRPRMPSSPKVSSI